MKVLSLFDGIGCGLVALKRAGIQVDEYIAYEINEDAIYVSNKNHPEIINKGSVVNVDFSKYADFDLIIAGSPCQGFSLAGYREGFDDLRSGLYKYFLQAKNQIPKADWLLENVKMDWHYEQQISKDLWKQPIEINSQLVSAQVRKRLYWGKKNIIQPIDKGITLQSVFEIEYEKIQKYKVKKTPSRDTMWLRGKCPDITLRDKSNCLTTKQDRWANAGLIKFEDYCRYLTEIECERLQTLPDDYTAGVSKTARYEMIGNCWTVDVIKDIFEQWYVNKS